MNEFYTRVSSTTKRALYQFMKDHEISLLNYHFDYFFQFCIQENNIQVLPHHFSNHKIEGLTVVDGLGTSFSYERDNPKIKQNFTLCHELGHFILKHDGSYFTESIDNQENLVEREADIFSAVVLMPDIVLLSKIYYSCDTFHQVQNSLEVSKQALFYRLSDFLREYYSDNEGEATQAIESYIEGKNSFIFHLFHDIREQIIEEFNQFKPSLINQVKQKVRKVGFTTSLEYPDLLNQDNWKAIKASSINIKTWLVYNKGKSIAYVWDKEKFSDEEARNKAELQLLLM
ncbi:ImmA/IrrE family metallo-endopeptidase [Streptococcus thermophilus]|uniref:ImmA/IrrE family metallo-endopeptidase n=1 Tax=Streptococcus thermophilus TaxID=1308 RepID=UPI0015C230A9|nr:ImmA/IrrE family metallo-endopeptidase [Streptococcus thermophilus]MBZ5769950.1 ImmA/IrrE family metallo-endopeptidase [Streptococcus thermophilus]MBZ5812764.1 ImmA/IrrE family metallo-endopeptidase [Streptococcus thermophilus]MCE2157742.1 ImmA/IrrE family metallo-endopeptidase [Streptococcus thermophilus]MCE2166388.1 ImmA/IrrE family metallo-endopeptidase [Streptococcus thermophilus]MCE2167698.1 ImmA/IrrE family metallo-endopeptidase [Streptococcus thermophilus]